MDAGAKNNVQTSFTRSWQMPLLTGKKKKQLWDKRTDVNYRRLYRLADPVKLTRVQIVQMTEHLNIFSVSVIAFLEAGDLSAH